MRGAEFLSTPSARRATTSAHRNALSWVFLSTPSARRATVGSVISAIKQKLFLSTPSARRATTSTLWSSSCSRYFYPRPPRGGRLYRSDCSCRCSNFYPRPPRGGRRQLLAVYPRPRYISIHALREEGDQRFFALSSRMMVFLSTPSARRATGLVADIGDVLGHFYPRPPRGGRPLQPVGLRTPDVISIHALREEGDRVGCRTPAP